MLKEFYSGKRLTEKSRRNHECVVGLRNKINPRSFEKISRIIDDTLDEVVEGAHTRFVYTRTGFLLGHSAKAPHADVNYIWEKVPLTLIGKTTEQLWDPVESKLVLRTIGSMVMWRIAARADEEWLVSFIESGKIDVVTGNEIKIAQYWMH